MEPITDPQQIQQALGWIVALLDRHHVPYQLVGGLAAQAYGARRPLIDIDLYAPFDQAPAALAELAPYLTRLPGPHRSAAWQLDYLALTYAGVEIEIGDSQTDPRFYNVRDQRWEPQVIDYTASNRVNLYGVSVAVMPRAELLRYKAMLARAVDHQDIAQMTLPGE